MTSLTEKKESFWDALERLREQQPKQDGISRGGFEPIPLTERPCSHPQHHPPSHLHIPHGMQYRHFCPACGRESLMRSAQVTL